MILYELICENAHGFESWFRNSETYDAQVAAGEVTCPMCGTMAVSKALMAPRLSPRRRETAPVLGPSGEAETTVAAGNPQSARLTALLQEVRAEIEQTFTDVGDRFAEEARRMHYNEREAAPIYGEATLDDARDLIEEGIEVMPLPWSRRTN